MGVTVYGSSDDLIEVDGGLREEFPYQPDGDGQYLAFSNGIVIHIEYDQLGVWRIKPVCVPEHQNVDIQQAPADDDENYSDRATVAGPIKWVLLGDHLAHSGRR
jgi:hypothetical protein